MQDPLEQLMEAVCETGDEAASIIDIDAAIARGAMSDPAAEPLHYAAMGRRSHVIRHLYARGATLAAELAANLAGIGGSPFVGKSRGDTALHAAAEDRWFEGLELILSLDPCPTVAMTVYDTVQRTPLIIAAKQGDMECIRVLLAYGADVNEYDSSYAGDSALEAAVREGHTEVVRLLLSHHANVMAPGWMGGTPLHRARKHAIRSPEILAMIEKAGGVT